MLNEPIVFVCTEGGFFLFCLPGEYLEVLTNLATRCLLKGRWADDAEGTGQRNQNVATWLATNKETTREL